jgi:hypothetical protein
MACLDLQCTADGVAVTKPYTEINAVNGFMVAGSGMVFALGR